MSLTKSLLSVVLLTLLLPPPSLLATEAVQVSKTPLTMGIFPRRNAKMTMKLFRPLQKHLSQALKQEIRLVTAKNFKTFWQGVKQQKYDLVHYNQYHYIVSQKKYGYQVLLRNEEFGEDTIAGALMVRTDSGIDTIADLKGKKIIFGGGPKAMQSYIVATYLLRQGGLQAGDYIEDFAKNPPNAILTAFYGQAAAAGAGDKVLDLKVVKQQIDSSKMKMLARAPQLPHLPWAVKADMAPELRDKIQTLLLQLKNDDQGQKILKNARLSGFQAAKDADYDPHREIIKTVYGDDFAQ